jgi:hypothetical protein
MYIEFMGDYTTMPRRTFWDDYEPNRRRRKRKKTKNKGPRMGL